MRASILAALPFVVAALAQSSSDAVNTTVVAVSSGSTTVSSTYTYSNFETQFLTETNSYGVVTGQPSVVTSQAVAGVAVTTQPEVATIPAGLPDGITTIVIAAGNTSANSFIVSIGSSTTVVLGGAVNTDASVVTGASAGVASGSVVTATGATGTTTTGGAASSTSAASAAASSGAADNVHVASGVLLGLGALVAAFL